MKLAEILENLRQPLPAQSLASKAIKGQQITYVPWHGLADLLDDRVGLGGWEWQVKDISQVGDRLILTGCLTVHGSDRSLTMDATGSEELSVNSYGDPSSNAEAMALRRAAAKMGLGRELWSKPVSQPSNQKRGSQEITRDEWLKLKKV